MVLCVNADNPEKLNDPDNSEEGNYLDNSNKSTLQMLKMSYIMSFESMN